MTNRATAIHFSPNTLIMCVAMAEPRPLSIRQKPKAPPMVYSSRNCWNMVPTEGRKAVKIEVMPSGVQKDTNRVQAKTVRNRLTPLKLR